MTCALRPRLALVVMAALLVVGCCEVIAPSVAEAAGGPGSMSVKPSSLTAGSTGLSLKFKYVAPAATTRGSVVLEVPTGWTTPQDGDASAAGYVTVNKKTCTGAQITNITGTGPWAVKIKVSCNAGTKLVLKYGDVSAPTEASTYQFPVSFTSGGTTSPLATSPAVTVNPATLDYLTLQGSASTVSPPLESTTADYTGTFNSSYTAEGYDQYGNDLGDVTSATTFSITPDGACSGNVCSVSATGEHTVTGTDGSASGQASLEGSYSAANMTCRGQNYDIDGQLPDGCEQLQKDDATTQGTADSLGSIACTGNVQFSGSVLSDTRVHQNPTVAAFNPATGSAPIWKSIDATGGEFCENQLALTLTVSGSADPDGCYSLTAITDNGTFEATTNSSGTAQIDEGNGAYDDDSTIFLEVQKECDVNVVTEAVTYGVSGSI